MVLPNFELLEPESVEEASRLLVEHDAVPFAGGTAIIPLMRQRIFQPSHLVSLQKLEVLTQIVQSQSGGLLIGATTTLRAIETHPLVREKFPLLAETVGKVANVRVRGGATLGGNLSHGDYRLDPPAALFALGAQIRLGSARGERSISVQEFLLGFFETAKEPDEIILGVELPAPAKNASSHYLKFTSHASTAWPCMGVAAILHWDDSGKCVGAQVALTAASARPLEVAGLEEFFNGTEVTESIAQHIGELVQAQLDPIEDASGSAWFKKEIAPVLVRRAVMKATERKSYPSSKE